MQSHNAYNISGAGQKILPIFNVRKRPRQALYAVPSTLSQEAEKKPSIQLQQCSQSSAAHADSKGDWNKPSGSFHNSGASGQQSNSSNTGRGTFQKYVKANQGGPRKIPPAKLLRNNHLKDKATSSHQSANVTYPVKNCQTTQLEVNSSMSALHVLTPSTSHFSQRQSKKSSVPQMKSSNFQKSLEQPVSTPAKTATDKVLVEDVKKFGNSLKVLTVGIEGVKKWSQILADDGILVFEVFGRINSNVASNERSNAKLFTLQDGNHALRCIFYETDRSLPHVQKGQMLRCVGSFQDTMNIFHCVTIRIVSPTEQRWVKAQISACDKALRSALAVTKIEP